LQGGKSPLQLSYLFLTPERYYANSVLDLVHRSKALGEWGKLAKGESVALERALGAFDLFVVHDQSGDLLEV
jgi:F-box protein 21